MDKIDKIRQEIKRRHDYENEMYHKKKPDGRPNDGWAESLAIMGVLEELLSFIDTLSEEPDKSLEESGERGKGCRGYSQLARFASRCNKMGRWVNLIKIYDGAKRKDGIF